MSAVEQEPAALVGSRELEEERDAGREEDEQPPVVREREEHGEDRERRQEPAVAQDERVDEARHRQEAQERRQRVHARLLRVVREERVQRRDDRRHPARPPPGQGATGPQRGGDRQQREGDRQAVRLALAVAEDRDPDVQQQVVQRRRAVQAQDRRDVRQRVRRDADRQALVDPEAGEQRAGAQVRRHAHEQDERDDPRRDRQRRCADAVQHAESRGRGGHGGLQGSQAPHAVSILHSAVRVPKRWVGRPASESSGGSARASSAWRARSMTVPPRAGSSRTCSPCTCSFHATSWTRNLLVNGLPQARIASRPPTREIATSRLLRDLRLEAGVAQHERHPLGGPDHRARDRQHGERPRRDPAGPLDRQRAGQPRDADAADDVEQRGRGEQVARVAAVAALGHDHHEARATRSRATRCRPAGRCAGFARGSRGRARRRGRPTRGA